MNRGNATKLALITCNTQGNKPAIAKACATKLLSQGADIIMTTCDVDFAAPVIQTAINRGKLTVAACIGTDQMGPKRFGAKGRLAFSFGNVAQDEGSAMAEYAWRRGWRTASLATDTVIVYFRNVVQAFKARFTQLGGKIAAEETYQSLGGNQASWSERRDSAQQRRRGRDRHLDGGPVRCAGADHDRSPHAREQHADPELVGRRRELLVRHAGSEGLELLLRDVRVGFR